MFSEEKKSPLASKDEENCFACFANSGKIQLVHCLLCSLLIGLLLVGTFLFKQPGALVSIQFYNPFAVNPESSTKQSHDDAECPQVNPLSPRHTNWRLKAMDRILWSTAYKDFLGRSFVQGRSVSDSVLRQYGW